MGGSEAWQPHTPYFQKIPKWKYSILGSDFIAKLSAKTSNDELMAEKGENRKIRIIWASMYLLSQSCWAWILPFTILSFFSVCSSSSLPLRPIQLQSSSKGALRRLKVILDIFLFPASPTSRALRRKFCSAYMQVNIYGFLGNSNSWSWAMSTSAQYGFCNCIVLASKLSKVSGVKEKTCTSLPRGVDSVLRTCRLKVKQKIIAFHPGLSQHTLEVRSPHLRDRWLPVQIENLSSLKPEKPYKSRETGNVAFFSGNLCCHCCVSFNLSHEKGKYYPMWASPPTHLPPTPPPPHTHTWECEGNQVPRTMVGDGVQSSRGGDRRNTWREEWK